MHTNVSIRGLAGDEQGRTLVLFDGIPINTSDELDELNKQTGWKRVLIYNSMAIICAPAGTSFP